MQARQSDRMARVQGFLNAQWKSESDGVQWFDPDRDSLYPDTLDLWMTESTRWPSGAVAESAGPCSAAEPLLGLQQVPLGDQHRGDGVPEPVQGDVRMPLTVGERGEPVAERGAAQPLRCSSATRPSRWWPRPPTVSRRSRWSGRTRPMWRCSTSGCRAWTAPTPPGV